MSSSVGVPAGLSKEFFALMKKVGEAKSRLEESRIATTEANILKERMSGKDVSGVQMKEFLIRAVYCELLGVPCEHAYINAVKMTQSPDIARKKLGYLAAALFLHPDHELTLLMVSSMTRDLKSPNFLEVSAALTAIPKLLNADMLPAVMPSVVDLIKHEAAMVRKKAVACMHHLVTVCPEQAEVHMNVFRQALCDPDPCVMGVSLNIFLTMAKENPRPFRDLVPSFVSILKQVVEGRLASDYTYHNVPAPWIQMKVLRLLAILGKDDIKTSEGMYEILKTTLIAADVAESAAFAVVYECVRTITAVYPNPELLHAAARAIARFIQIENHSLRYMGITALADIVRINPRAAAEHQTIVVRCLDDPDETLRRRTLELLYRMTNRKNVVAISQRLIASLRTTVDAHFRAELVARITESAERYAPDTLWYVRTMNAVFVAGGKLVDPAVAHNVARLIGEGTGEGDDADDAFRAAVVRLYRELAHAGGPLPDVLIQLIAWVLGEYAYVTEDAVSLDATVDSLCDLLDRNFTDEAATRVWILSALAKLAAAIGEVTPAIASVVERYRGSSNIELQQRAIELGMLTSARPELLEEVFPFDGSAEDLDVDPTLPFLSGYVNDALHNGAAPYASAAERAEWETKRLRPDVVAATKKAHGQQLRFDAYENPTEAAGPLFVMPDLDSTDGGSGGHGGAQAAVEGGGPGGGGDGVGGAAAPPPPVQSGLGLRAKKRLWTVEGYAAEVPADPEPPRLATSTADASHSGGGGSSGVSGGGGGGGGRQSEEQRAAAAAAAAAAALSDQERALFGGIDTDSPGSRSGGGSGLFGTTDEGGGGSGSVGSVAGKTPAQRREERKALAEARKRERAAAAAATGGGERGGIDNNSGSLVEGVSSPSAATRSAGGGSGGGGGGLFGNMTVHTGEATTPTAASQGGSGGSGGGGGGSGGGGGGGGGATSKNSNLMDLIDVFGTGSGSSGGGSGSGASGSGGASGGDGAGKVPMTDLLSLYGNNSSSGTPTSGGAGGGDGGSGNTGPSLLDGIGATAAPTTAAATAVGGGSGSLLDAGLTNTTPTTSSNASGSGAGAGGASSPAAPAGGYSLSTAVDFPPSPLFDSVAAYDRRRVVAPTQTSGFPFPVEVLALQLPDALGLLLVARSQSDEPCEASFGVEPPAGVVVVAAESDPAGSPTGSSGSGLSVVVPPTSTAYVLFKVSLGDSFRALAGVTATVTAGGAGMPLPVTLSFTDFFRPNALSTNKFGKLWGSLSRESKESVEQPPVGSLEEVMAVFENGMCATPVQIIDKEGIIAGQTVSGVPILIHVKLKISASGKKIDVTVRSKSSGLSKSALAVAAGLFKSKGGVVGGGSGLGLL